MATKSEKLHKALSGCLKISTYEKSNVRKGVLNSMLTNSGLTKAQVKQYFG